MRTERKEVGAISGVDLGADGWVQKARRRRALAAHAEDTETEIARLIRRASWLRRKAARLPIGNGRRKAQSEAAACQVLALLLGRALAGDRTPQVPLVGKPHLDRAARLLHTLLAA